MLSRRKLLLGAGALLAAPVIVRAESLMPVSSRALTGGFTAEQIEQIANAALRYYEAHLNCARIAYGRSLIRYVGPSDAFNLPLLRRLENAPIGA